MALVDPPEGVLAQDLVLLKVDAHPTTLVVGQHVLVEERVDARDAAVQGILQILHTLANLNVASLAVTKRQIPRFLTPRNSAQSFLQIQFLDAPTFNLLDGTSNLSSARLAVLSLFSAYIPLLMITLLP